MYLWNYLISRYVDLIHIIHFISRVKTLDDYFYHIKYEIDRWKLNLLLINSKCIFEIFIISFQLIPEYRIKYWWNLSFFRLIIYANYIYINSFITTSTTLIFIEIYFYHSLFRLNFLQIIFLLCLILFFLFTKFPRNEKLE